MTRAVGWGGADEPWLSGHFTIGPEHPALAGHFPGNPVVPGVTVLQRVLALVESAQPERTVESVAEAKFLRPLRPAETCAVAIRRVDDRTLSFDCRVQQDLVARGILVLDGDN